MKRLQLSPKRVCFLTSASLLFTPCAGQATAQTENASQTKSEQNKAPTPVAKPESPAETLEARNKKFQSLEAFTRVLNHLETMYVDEKAVSSEALIERALKGMVSAHDLSSGTATERTHQRYVRKIRRYRCRVDPTERPIGNHRGHP